MTMHSPSFLRRLQGSANRPLHCVPWPVRLALPCLLALQCLWHANQAPPAARISALTPPPSYAMLRLASLGESAAFAKFQMLSLQAHDYQAGHSIPFSKLDYVALRGWLGAILDLDPPAQYPLLAAARLYAEAPGAQRARMMTEFVHQRFLEDPNRRWEAMAHAAVLARHRLHDMQLAHKYAKALREHARDPKVPAWVRQMEIFLLEDMNELQAARLLLGAVLANNEAKDPQEVHFLLQRLQEMERKLQAQAISAP
ncbi:hypothetical protein V8J88_09540 [Massilia sp. W12]|uniref:hypothetical protein n=1 Tax=Massilia sp. W12 TaxID=3126507 RepID=UPI0030D5D9D5